MSHPCRRQSLYKSAGCALSTRSFTCSLNFSVPILHFGLMAPLHFVSFLSTPQALEPRFGAEIFATILSIPSTKTLLRRHLSTHFVALIGGAVQQMKRTVEMQPGYVQLTPGQKVKVGRRLCVKVGLWLLSVYNVQTGRLTSQLN